MKDRTLPRPVGRRILVLIIALFIASVVWLMLQEPDTPEPSGEPPGGGIGEDAGSVSAGSEN